MNHLQNTVSTEIQMYGVFSYKETYFVDRRYQGINKSFRENI